jgi:membrane protein
MNFAVLKATWSAFNEDRATRLAAAIAYSTIFSIAPLFIVCIAVLGAQNGGLGHQLAETRLLGLVEHSVGPDAASAIKGIIANAYAKPRQTIVAQVVGWITFIVGASALFSSFQDALNSIWHIEATGGGWKHMLRQRVASFGMLTIVGFLLLVSSVGTLLVSSLGSNLLGRFLGGENSILVEVLSQLLTIVIVMAVFSAMYKFLPDVKISWRDVLVGAFVTTILFTVGELLVAVYFHRAGITSSYGAAGAILVALLWIYYTAIIFLLGAEYTKIQAKTARTEAPTKLRMLVDQPAGIDPRTPELIAQHNGS